MELFPDCTESQKVLLNEAAASIFPEMAKPVFGRKSAPLVYAKKSAAPAPGKASATRAQGKASATSATSKGLVKESAPTSTVKTFAPHVPVTKTSAASALTRKPVDAEKIVPGEVYFCNYCKFIYILVVLCERACELTH